MKSQALKERKKAKQQEREQEKEVKKIEQICPIFLIKFDITPSVTEETT